MRQFKAPWSSSLKVVTAVCVVILGGIALAGLLAGPRDRLAWQIGMVGLPLATLLAALPFMIFGYRIERDTLKAGAWAGPRRSPSRGCNPPRPTRQR